MVPGDVGDLPGLGAALDDVDAAVGQDLEAVPGVEGEAAAEL